MDGLQGTRICFSNFELYHLKAEAGIGKSSGPVIHENTAEVCVVLSGKIKITVQGESHELGPDAALRFNALFEYRIDVVEDSEFLLIHHSLP
jgi:XRE family transcriptional regulator, regulator of sulfur utilization